MDEILIRKPPRTWTDERARLWKRWLPTIIALIFLSTIFWVEAVIVKHNVTEKVTEELTVRFEQELNAYKQQVAEEAQAEHWLSGDASREAAINQSIDSVAMVIARLSTDQQKLTEASCMLARVMSPSYPNSFQEVCEQDQQWMFYDGSNKTFSEHDRELAEMIVRPYMEDGIVPNGLTAQMVYGEWTTSDFVLRDTWEKNSRAHYWRYS